MKRKRIRRGLEVREYFPGLNPYVRAYLDWELDQPGWLYCRGWSLRKALAEVLPAECQQTVYLEPRFAATWRGRDLREVVELAAWQFDLARRRGGGRPVQPDAGFLERLPAVFALSAEALEVELILAALEDA